ncbi:DUF4124 domain-containing protein [Motiliproteus sp. MSK22-1]|uniref:DUF4124 domain-containing protein n=1 Tax=Motiliproteus sp. MSK22-1 TaxID=1897630 RepID=UPI000977F243|nr:DUF4124 domain-containing protein [Motiliproteus sp. MSK22-1]OMH34800.1 hypothetical protein BGP75_10875 [Motiliproteus sp. MSK22-1]
MHCFHRCTLSLITLLTLGVAATVHADIYKWYDKDGTVNYSQQPPVGVEAEQIRHADKAATRPNSLANSRQSISNYLKQYASPSEQDQIKKASRSSSQSTSSNESAKENDDGNTYAKKSRKQKKLRNLTEQKEAYRVRNALGNKRKGGDEVTNRVKIPSKLSKKLADRSK